MNVFFVFVCSMLAIGIALGCRSEPPLDVAEVDLQRFAGRWYEIAKLPRPTQRGCEDTTAFYRLKDDGELDVVNECVRDGAAVRVTARAVVTDASAPGKLAIDVGAFFGDYWILEVGDQGGDQAGAEYGYAVIGHPAREYLWILSRTPTMDDAVLKGVLARTAERQFDVSRLEYTTQHERAEGEPDALRGADAPREYGCMVGKMQRARPGGGALVLALGVCGALVSRASRRAGTSARR